MSFYLLGLVENLSQRTRTAAALSAQTLWRSMVLSIVPYQRFTLNQINVEVYAALCLLLIHLTIMILKSNVCTAILFAHFMAEKNFDGSFTHMVNNIPLYLEICDPSPLPLEQTLKLQVRWHLVEDEDLTVDILSGRVKEVIKKVADSDIGNVPTKDYELSLRLNLQTKESLKYFVQTKFKPITG